MAYSGQSIPRDHSEFGGGPGMIDPQRRADRVLDPHEEGWEIKATNPASESASATGSGTEELSEVPVPRVLDGLL